MTDTKTSETELAKKVTNAVLGVLARGEDNLAIYRAVETALRTHAPALPEREKIAEIIDPHFRDAFALALNVHRKRQALAKADAILSLLSAPQPVDQGDK